MCNAYRHPPGCECGWGPPYPGVLGVGNATEWAEEIIHERWLARQGLTELGWTQRSIEEFLAQYSELMDGLLPPPTLVNRFKEMLGRYRVEEEHSWREVIRVPLFRFGAPRARGASVLYSEGECAKKGAFWKLKLFGGGTGPTQEFTYTTSCRYRALNGQCKQVFVPVRIRVARVRVIEDGREVGRGFRAQVVLPKTKDQCWVRGRGVVDLGRDQCGREDDALPEDDFDYAYASDGTGVSHEATRSWEVDVSREVSLQLKKADVGLELVARVSRVKMMAVDLTLPAGHDYLGFRTPGALWWEQP